MRHRQSDAHSAPVKLNAINLIFQELSTQNTKLSFATNSRSSFIWFPGANANTPIPPSYLGFLSDTLEVKGHFLRNIPHQPRRDTPRDLPSRSRQLPTNGKTDAQAV